MLSTGTGAKWQRRRPQGPLLYVDLVPRTSWCSNLRKALSVSDWRKISQACYEEAGHRCVCCGGKGRAHAVECHERWKFEDGKQILVGLEALCPACHESTHMGLACVRDREESAMRHLAYVNKWTMEQAYAHAEEAWKVWEERSRHQWRLDATYLNTWASAHGIILKSTGELYA